MNYVILDTNILVSGMLANRASYPAQLLQDMINRMFIPVYSQKILEEYRDVLSRPKFNFTEDEITFILDQIVQLGLCEDYLIGMTGFPRCRDADDQIFYDTAHAVDALLVTGNKKDFPDENRIFTPAEYYS